MSADVKPKRSTRVWPRVIPLALALASLLSGLDAALLRLGARAPVQAPDLALDHGILMVYGFIGTAITLERAVALQSNGPQRWAYAAPIASAMGGVATVAIGLGAPLPGGRAIPGGAWLASMTLFVAIYVAVWRRQPSIAVLIQILGALSGAAGIALWTSGVPVPQLVGWWAMMLVLTIIGERLELARVAFASKRLEWRLLVEASAVFLALVIATLDQRHGLPVLGIALAALIIDTAIHDVAFRTVRAGGLTGFMGACMIAGYAWALVAAAIWITAPDPTAGYAYDAAVHSLTIGFVMSMILAHAPVIVPALVRRELPYHPVMWVAWGLLQVGLLVRVLAGARASEPVWRIGGSLDVVGILVFMIATVTLVLSSGRAQAHRKAERAPRTAGTPGRGA